MNLNLINSIILAGIIQGLFLSVFILSSKKTRARSSIYLGLLILCFTLSNLQHSLEEMEAISWDVFNFLYLPYFFLVPTFLYFFVMTFLYPERKTKTKEKLLYIPFIFMLFISIVYKILVVFVPKTETVNDTLQTITWFIDVYGDFINIPMLFFIIIVLLFSIKKYQKAQKEFNLRIIKVQLLWLKILLFTLLATVFPWLYYTIAFTTNYELLFIPLYLLTSIIIYILGYVGVHKIGINNERKKIRKFNESHRSYSITERRQNEHVFALEKLLIDERKFLDSNLTLESLSETLSLSKGHLSRVINTELGTSFSDYINTLRVEEAKSYLQNPDFSNYTLVAIGLEAGFNSKSTFNNAFKKITGFTPSQFKKEYTN